MFAHILMYGHCEMRHEIKFSTFIVRKITGKLDVQMHQMCKWRLKACLVSWLIPYPRPCFLILPGPAPQESRVAVFYQPCWTVGFGTSSSFFRSGYPGRHPQRTTLGPLEPFIPKLSGTSPTRLASSSSPTSTMPSGETALNTSGHTCP